MTFDIITRLKDYLSIRLNKWLPKLLGNNLVVNYLLPRTFLNSTLVLEHQPSWILT